MISETQLTELKNLLPAAGSVLIALPVNANLDRLAAGLALFLSLKLQKKEVGIISGDSLKVSQAHLFGIDHIQNSLSLVSGGNLTLVMENVASNGTVPSLEKLDWLVQGNNLNLIFRVLPGQTFRPARIVPHYQGSGYNLIFVIGAENLNSLGNIYTQNTDKFTGAHIVNIDNQPTNTGFGQSNLVDQTAASICEMVLNVMVLAGMPLDSDIATNLLAGIYDGTQNLTSPKVNADTFQVIANCMKAGGKKTDSPGVPTGQGLDLSSLIPQSSPLLQPNQSGTPPEPYTVPPVVAEPAPSPEERPYGEGVASAETLEPEPDWLTPKVFSGKSIG